MTGLVLEIQDLDLQCHLFQGKQTFCMASWIHAPAFEVEKNTGLMLAKSPSSCMRCIRTEPTMPRQPTSPTDGVAAVVILPV